ncbi:hypothetical protein BC830DRAFT_882311 [Chytriomyces sp. MP71]|nr:hypothetical protein BC830DRAFT_882311 [Chytriomyces sp. MP71]
MSAAAGIPQFTPHAVSVFHQKTSPNMMQSADESGLNGTSIPHTRLTPSASADSEANSDSSICIDPDFPCWSLVHAQLEHLATGEAFDGDVKEEDVDRRSDGIASEELAFGSEACNFRGNRVDEEGPVAQESPEEGAASERQKETSETDTLEALNGVGDFAQNPASLKRPLCCGSASFYPTPTTDIDMHSVHLMDQDILLDDAQSLNLDPEVPHQKEVRKAKRLKKKYYVF